MRSLMRFALAVALFGLGTAVLGWWTVPLIAALWGLVRPDSGVWWRAFVAGAAAWGLLLAVVAYGGPANELADRLGEIFGTSGVAVVVATLVLPGLAASTAAELAASMRRLAGSSAGR